MHLKYEEIFFLLCLNQYFPNVFFHNGCDVFIFALELLKLRKITVFLGFSEFAMIFICDFWWSSGFDRWKTRENLDEVGNIEIEMRLYVQYRIFQYS